MAYKYSYLVLNCKTPRRSLRQLNETRRRIKKFYNYRSQSAANQFIFKDFFLKCGAIAMVSFSRVVPPNSEDLRVNSNGDGKENVVKQFFSCPLQNINIENT